MAVEQLIFAIISFALFIYMFYKIIKKNDTSYFIMIILQAIAIALNFFEFLFKVKLNLLFMIIKYVIGLLLPITIIILEKYNIPFTEIVDLTKADIFLRLKDSKKAKQALIHLITKQDLTKKKKKLKKCGHVQWAKYNGPQFATGLT